MTSWTIQPATKLHGEITVPGDKSISHRLLIFGALAEGESRIEGLLLGEDVLCTMRILQQLGVSMSHKPESIRPGDTLIIQGRGLKSLRGTTEVLDCGNSGTSMRLLMGLFAGQPFESVLTGDDSLNRRPMDRVMEPLSQMGAKFETFHENGRRFIKVIGNPSLKGIDFKLKVASAQLKSALLLAGLYAQGSTSVEEPSLSRDHTERILKASGLNLEIQGLRLTLKPGKSLKPFTSAVPSDFSSAAFFMVAGLIVPGSDIIIRAVGTNPTRCALAGVLKGMGGQIDLLNARTISGEPVGDYRVRTSALKGCALAGEIIPKLIDEIPIFAVAAASASGTSEVSDAHELRVKESDRISCLAQEIRKFGVSIQEKEDGFILQGAQSFGSGVFESYGDHRIAMSMTIAALRGNAPSTIQNVDCVATSFPSFFDILTRIRS